MVQFTLTNICLPEILINISNNQESLDLIILNKDIEYKKLVIVEGQLLCSSNFTYRDFAEILVLRNKIVRTEEKYDAIFPSNNDCYIPLEQVIIKTLNVLTDSQWKMLSDKLPSEELAVEKTDYYYSLDEYFSSVEKYVLKNCGSLKSLKALSSRSIYSSKDLCRSVYILELLNMVRQVPPSSNFKFLDSKIFKEIDYRFIFTSFSSLGFLFLILLSGFSRGFDLKILDLLIKTRSKKAVDDVVLVTFDEQDLSKLKEYPLTDETLAKTIDKVLDGEPIAVGFDLYRNFKVGQGSEKLNKILTENDNVYGIHKTVYDPKTNQGKVDPNPVLEKLNRSGFNDAVLDNDRLVRRALLSLAKDDKIQSSLGLMLAQEYFDYHNVRVQQLEKGSNVMLNDRYVYQIKNPLLYKERESHGYQFLLDRFSQLEDIETISLTDLLNNNVNPQVFFDKIVILGSTASSLNDFISVNGGKKTPGLLLHANVVDRLISISNGDKSIKLASIEATLIYIAIAYTIILFLFHYIDRFGGSKFKTAFVISFLTSLSSLSLFAFIFIKFAIFFPVIPNFLSLFLISSFTLLFKKTDYHDLVFTDRDFQIPNFAYFHKQIQFCIDSNLESNYSLIVIKIDNFESIMSSLPEKAKLILKNLKLIISKFISQDSSCFAKLSDDRFGVFFSGDDQVAINLFSNNLKYNLQQLAQKYNIHIIYGMASFSEDEIFTPVEILMAADTNLLENISLALS